MVAFLVILRVAREVEDTAVKVLKEILSVVGQMEYVQGDSEVVVAKPARVRSGLKIKLAPTLMLPFRKISVVQVFVLAPKRQVEPQW